MSDFETRKLAAELKDWRDVGLRLLWLAAAAIPKARRRETLAMVAMLLDAKAEWPDARDAIARLHDGGDGLAKEPDAAPAIEVPGYQPAPQDVAAAIHAAGSVAADIDVLKRGLGARTDMDLAARLGVLRFAVAKWRARGSIPEKYRPLLAESTPEGMRRALVEVVKRSLPPGLDVVRGDEA